MIWPLWHLANRARLTVEGPLRGGAICQGPTTQPWVALTFDDGPDARWTPGILDALGRAGARATFFAIGEHLERDPELARAVARDHQIGTHLYSHKRGITHDRTATVRELEQVMAVHQRILGARPSALRYPFGDRGVWTSREISRFDLTPYHWSFSSLDSRARTGSDIVRFVVPRLAPGSIVLLHDGRGADSTLGSTRTPTVDALPEILQELANQRLCAVTLDQMFRVPSPGSLVVDSPDVPDVRER